MRHQNAGRKFSRNTSHRRAMFRNLAANLITHERIETTDEKAKELRRVAERLITKAKRLGEVAFAAQANLKPEDKARRLHAQRLVASFLPRFGTRVVDGEPKKVDLVEKVFCDLAKRYQGREGGYTRIVKLGQRRGDNASISIIELVGELSGPKNKRGELAEASALVAAPAMGGVSTGGRPAPTVEAAAAAEAAPAVEAAPPPAEGPAEEPKPE